MCWRLEDRYSPFPECKFSWSPLGHLWGGFTAKELSHNSQSMDRVHAAVVKTIYNIRDIKLWRWKFGPHQFRYVYPFVPGYPCGWIGLRIFGSLMAKKTQRDNNKSMASHSGNNIKQWIEGVQGFRHNQQRGKHVRPSCSLSIYVQRTHIWWDPNHIFFCYLFTGKSGTDCQPLLPGRYHHCLLRPSSSRGDSTGERDQYHEYTSHDRVSPFDSWIWFSLHYSSGFFGREILSVNQLVKNPTEPFRDTLLLCRWMY